MSCLSSARYGLLLAALISAGLSAAPLSPADQNAIEQQQKALLEQSQQQRDMLRNSTPAPHSRKPPLLKQPDRVLNSGISDWKMSRFSRVLYNEN